MNYVQYIHFWFSVSPIEKFSLSPSLSLSLSLFMKDGEEKKVSALLQCTHTNTSSVFVFSPVVFGKCKMNER